MTCHSHGIYVLTVLPVSLISGNTHGEQRKASSMKIRRNKSSDSIVLWYGRMATSIEEGNADAYTNGGFDTDGSDITQGKRKRCK